MPHDACVAPLESAHLILGSDVGGVAQLVALNSVPSEAQAVEGGALVVLVALIYVSLYQVTSPSAGSQRPLCSSSQDVLDKGRTK